MNILKERAKNWMLNLEIKTYGIILIIKVTFLIINLDARHFQNEMQQLPINWMIVTNIKTYIQNIECLIKK